MRIRILQHVLIYTAFFLFECVEAQKINSIQQEKLEIAFMPDVHFHDVFAELEDNLATGLQIMHNGENKNAFIRTMESQLTSTRLFNENYFAFVAALDDAVDRGIKLIALPGDFSDDGQPVHIKGLVKILNRYRDEHGVQFFIAPGNHDPSRPFTTEGGKRNFLGNDGRPQPIFSENHPICTASNRLFSQNSGNPMPHDVICTDEMKMLGYEGLFNLLGDFGLKPNETTLYYETPFGSFNPENDEFDKAEGNFMYSDRQYEICHEGTGGNYRESHYTNCFDVMDMSYLTEPADGLWLLAIDANVYIPVQNADTSSPGDPTNFSGSGNAGFNKVITHKQHLLEWIADVANRADEKGKNLIAFSHFPAADFYNQADQKIEEIWGENRFQLNRMPEKNTSKILAATGLKLHIGGHMHMNDTSVTHDPETGNFMYNIQVPSLAAYIPAYKIVRFIDNARVEVETIILDEVPDFKTFFPHYQDEWDYLDSIGYEGIWNREILNSASYREFTDWHIRELSRLRFLPREWPQKTRTFLTEFNGCDMLTFSQLNTTAQNMGLNKDDRIDIEYLQSEFPDLWYEAQGNAEIISRQAGINFSDLCQWSGKDLSVDFYRLRNADELALRDIPTSRLEQYSLVAGILAQNNVQIPADNERINLLFNQLFSGVFKVMHRFSDGLPANHFVIDLKNGDINDLTENQSSFDY